MSDTPAPPPPGYYDDGTGQQRYWDGQKWSETPAPAPAPAPAVELAPVAQTADPAQASQVGYAPAQPAAPVPARRGLGTWALVLGVIGIVFAFIPHVSGFGIFLGVVALILGGISLLRKGGRALVGTVLGAVALVLGIIFVNVYNTGPSSVPVPVASAATDSSTAASAAGASSSTAPKAPVAPPKPSAPNGTAAQLQALAAAKGYLSSGQGFSQAGLLAQLTSSFGNGFAQADAQWAVDNSGADWNAQALSAAKAYLSAGEGFSQAGLIAQLTSSSGSQFTEAQAEYGVAQSGADWNAQAVTAAKGYMATGIGFSRESLIDQLTSSSGSQFTEDQAEYAADQVGLN